AAPRKVRRGWIKVHRGVAARLTQRTGTQRMSYTLAAAAAASVALAQATSATTAPGEPTARASVCGCLRMYDRRCGPAGLLCPGARSFYCPAPPRIPHTKP